MISNRLYVWLTFGACLTPLSQAYTMGAEEQDANHVAARRTATEELDSFLQEAKRLAPTLTALPASYKEAESSKPMTPHKHLDRILENQDVYPVSPPWKYAEYHYLTDLTYALRTYGIDKWIARTGFKNNLSICPAELQAFHPMVSLIRKITLPGHKQTEAFWDRLSTGDGHPEFRKDAMAIVQSFEVGAKVWTKLLELFPDPENAVPHVTAFLEKFYEEFPQFSMATTPSKVKPMEDDNVTKILEGTSFFHLVMDAGLAFWNQKRVSPTASDNFLALVISMAQDKKYKVDFDFGENRGQAMKKIDELIKENFN